MHNIRVRWAEDSGTWSCSDAEQAIQSMFAPMARLARRMISVRPTTIGVHQVATAGSSRAPAMISGPIPVGSPIEIARVGFMAEFVNRWIRS